jgi:hypothetical protein
LEKLMLLARIEGPICRDRAPQITPIRAARQKNITWHEPISAIIWAHDRDSPSWSQPLT